MQFSQPVRLLNIKGCRCRCCLLLLCLSLSLSMSLSLIWPHPRIRFSARSPLPHPPSCPFAPLPLLPLLPLCPSAPFPTQTVPWRDAGSTSTSTSTDRRPGTTYWKKQRNKETLVQQTQGSISYASQTFPPPGPSMIHLPAVPRIITRLINHL